MHRYYNLHSRPIYRDIVIESLDFCRKKKGLIIVAYVIMSNHIHLIAQADESTKQGLSEIVRDFKKFTAKQIIAAIKSQPESRREWRQRPIEQIEQIEVKKHLYLYPNPASALVNYELTGKDNYSHSWSIINSIGQEVKTGQSKIAKGNINIEGLPSGLYYLSISLEGEVMTSPFTITQ